jgi:hypothetical protein
MTLHPINRRNLTFVIFLSLSLASFEPANAQKKKDKDKEKDKKEAPVPPKDAPKKISDVIKNCKAVSGLFTLYQDSSTGATHLLIEQKHLDKEYIYFSQFSDGVLDAWTFRGNYNQSMVFKIKKYFNRFEFVFINTSSYFDPKHPVSKAATANMSDAIVASLKVTAMNDTKDQFLVDADQLFLREAFTQVKPPMFPGQSPFEFTLGELDKDKTKINHMRSYPSNTDLEVEYVYSKPSVLNGGSRAVTDGRYVSLKVYHSLIEMPQNDYQPVFDDPRVGYFTTEVSDMTTLNTINYRDLVHRWHLKKKNPNETVSEPVEPITWWIENTTPFEIRPIIKHAGEQWNLAFEKAGFKNAVVIKQQPDDADWDAGDIRYNVLRWTSSPNLPFGGYGPSFVNPRTGQILGADIMLEYFTLANSLRIEKLMGTESTEQQKVMEMHTKNPSYALCHAGEFAHDNALFGKLSLAALGGDKLEESKMVNEFLHYLILHEMGHTMGLNHNMKSSQLHPIKDINNQALTSKIGLIGSVMDYPAVNFANDRKVQGNYWTTVPGPYDVWAIEFAYKPGMSDQQRSELLSHSTEPQLMFGNDADDMRWPGKAIDPRVNVNDLSSEAIQYSVDRIELTKKVSTEVMKKYNTEGKSYQEHAVAFSILMNVQAGSAATISRYVGGVYVDRALVGQKGATKPFIPVEAAKQKQAMDALGKYVFAPDAFMLSSDLYNYLQIQRRGFNFFGITEDPKLHRRVLFYQKDVLNHLLATSTTQRIVDSKLYGNAYGLDQMFSDLTNSIFKADINASVNSFRQNLQIEYTKQLIEIVNNKGPEQYMHSVVATALYNLKEIKKMAASPGGDLATQAHKEYLSTIITNALRELH